MEDGRSWLGGITHWENIVGSSSSCFNRLTSSVVQIPKSAILSLRTSSLPKLASKFTDEGKDTQPLWYLALALLHEIRLGRQSTFWGYIQILPRKHIPLPVLWPVKEIGQEDGRLGIRWLAGTEAQRDLNRKASEGQALVSGVEHSTESRPIDSWLGRPRAILQHLSIAGPL